MLPPNRFRLLGDSEAERIVDEHPELVLPGVEIPRMTNTEVGEHYWRLYTDAARSNSISASPPEPDAPAPYRILGRGTGVAGSCQAAHMDCITPLRIGAP